MRDEIISGMARTCLVVSYADASESAEFPTMRIAGGGSDWFDIVPEWDCPEVDVWAEAAVSQIENIIGSDVSIMCEEWCLVSGQDTERFAHCLAMRMLGTGVGLEDDLKWDSGWQCPDLGYSEFSYFEIDWEECPE
tara:strand:- start:111 stop:518 length:408 start_codon:yes stop_codon:yes gene_type:complete